MGLSLAGSEPDAAYLGPGVVDAIYLGSTEVWSAGEDLPADPRAFNLIGQPAGLNVGRNLAASAGAHNLTGVEPQLIKAIGLSASVTSYALTGTAAGLTYTEATKFPVVQTTATTQINANQSTHTVNLPAGITAGDLLIVFGGLADDSKWDNGLWDQATWDANVVIGTPTGWTGQYDLSGGTTNGRCGVFYKIASGSEGPSVDISLAGGASQGSWTAVRIDTYTGTPEFGISGADFVDPPSVTASWGSDKNLALAVVLGEGSRTVSAYPTNYTALAGTSGGSTHCWVASRDQEAATIDPGAYTLSGAADGRGITVLIRGD